MAATYENSWAVMRGPTELWDFEVPEYINRVDDWHCPICGNRVDDPYDCHFYESAFITEVFHRECYFDDEAREAYLESLCQA